MAHQVIRKLRKRKLRPPVPFKSKGKLKSREIARHIPSAYKDFLKKKKNKYVSAAKTHLKKALIQFRYGLHGGRDTEENKRLRDTK